MKQTFFLFLLYALIGFSCRPKEEQVRTDLPLRLRFSADTIRFDTVLTARATVSKRLTVYNPESYGVLIHQIRLQNEDRQFQLIVDGKPQNVLSNVRLLGKDSMLIVVQLHLNPTDEKKPFLIENRIEFLTELHSQFVLIRAYGQNAIYLSGSKIDTNTVWTHHLPYVVLDSVVVEPQAMLLIQQGARVFFDKNAYLSVKGSLQIQGSKDSLVRFLFSRQDISATGTNFKVAAGQWRGIRLENQSHHNRLQFFQITGATDGLTIFTSDSTLVSHGQIYHCFGRGIYAQKAHLNAFNLAIGNCSDFAIACQGGNYYFNHVTLGAYIARESQNNQGLGLLLANFVEKPTDVFPLRCLLENSVIAGANRNAEYIQIQQQSGADFVFKQSHCVLISRIASTENSNLLIHSSNRNTRLADSLFVSPWEMNFRVDTARNGLLSPLKNKAKLTFVHDDLDGTLRDSLPDIGAYEWKKI
ncbi:MAG: hypothetical protein NZM38_06980 [Cytophagales bacterium]|nr:hypothetical protein [Cytophagales bacterium]MDW8384500.1 hypothetical protein [Flammeovirgaceae bacterium]